MRAKPIDGKTVAAAITEDARKELEALEGVTPGLGVVLVGDDPASHLYVNLKEKACEDLGIRFEKHVLPERADLAEVMKTILKLNRDETVDAILVQLPLPKHLDDDEIIGLIDPAKDVDGFHPSTTDALLDGRPTVVPGLAAGIMALIHEATTRIEGKRLVVVANSETFATPIAHLAQKEGAFSAYVHPDAPDLQDSLGAADIVVVAVGKPGFLKGDDLKPGAIVIDVGTTRSEGKVVGDAAASVWDVASRVTPVPGGVGPVTVAMLLKNTVKLAKRRRN